MLRLRKLSWAVFLLAVVCFTTAQAANIQWSGANADANGVGYWDSPGNWAGDTEPTIDDGAWIYLAGATVVVDDFLPNEKVCDNVRVGWGETHHDITLLVTGGTFRCRSQLNVGLRGAKNCTLQVDGGHVIAEGRVRSARDLSATASFIINSGIVDVASSMALSELSSSGGVTLVMSGGVLNVDALETGQGAPVTIELNGGTINAGSFAMSTGATMDIKDGKIVVNGDFTDQFAQWFNLGRITGFGVPAERGSVKVSYDPDQNKTTVTADISQSDLNKAWKPSPFGGGAPLDTVLTWMPGDATAAAQGHDVYLGTDADAVENDTTENTLGTYQGRQSGLTYAIPLEPVLGETYYWRIDQIDKTTGEIHKGSLWFFTMQTNMLVEGFDTYASWWENRADLLETWKESGSAAAYIVDDAAVDVNSMEVSCHAQYGDGDAIMTLPLEADWARYGIRALNFMFKGDPNLSKLDVTLSDGTNEAKVTVTDPDILLTDAWRGVDIDLAQFTGVDLSHVRQLTLGVSYTGTALVNYDLIRVYPQRCMAQFGPTGDLNGDCIVDALDLEVLMEDWLESGYEVTAVEPGEAAAIHYDLDQTSGTTVTDKAGLCDATLTGTEQWDPAGGVDGSACLKFDGQLYMDLNNELVAFANIDKQFSFCLWVNGDPDSQPPFEAQRVMHAFMLAGYGIQFQCPNTSGYVNFAAGISPPDTTIWTGATPDDWEGEWNHYALVKDADLGIQRIYRNGELVAESDNAFKGIGVVKSMTFGGNQGDATPARGWEYHGKLDDIRIYGVTLSQAEILSLVGKETLKQGVYSSADLNGDDIVDQADRDILEANVGTEQLWPLP